MTPTSIYLAMSEKPGIIGPDLRTDETDSMMLETVLSLQIYLGSVNDKLRELTEFKKWAEPILKKCRCRSAQL